jgi:glycosyltransferase involved in cell wall biosynthesis/tetratricopeptide (TPR) repeat protein
MKVSVVIPVYNGHRYLREAIDSVVAQTYQNVEIIVVNDGSIDGGKTRNIAKSYGSKIRYIEQDNRGVAGALNAGLSVMTGEVFCWLSHDDIYRPAKIDRQVEFLKKLGRDDLILFSNYALIDEGGRITGEVAMETVIGDKPQLGLLRGCINGCTTFVPKKIFDEVGRFNENLRFTQDYDMWKRMSARHSFIFMPDVLVNYRTHREQGSRDRAATEESNKLWISLIDDTTVNDRATVAGSSLRFFQSQAEFLAGTAYSVASTHAWRRAEDCVNATKVSVVIPFYNEIATTKRALLSVLAQNHRNLEIIAVNDGSTDDLTDLNHIAATDPRVRILHKTNGGPGSARNIGLQASTGEYVAFLDCDDVWEPEKLTVQIRKMQETGHLFSHSSYNLVYPHRALGKVTRHTGKVSGHIYPDIIAMCPIHTSTVILHRKLVQDGFCFSEAFQTGEDCLLWIDIARLYPVLGVRAPMTTVEWSNTSATVSISRSLEGIRNVHDALSASHLHSKHMAELNVLTRTMTRLQNMQQSRRDAQDPDINLELVKRTFSPGAFRKVGITLATIVRSPVFAFDGFQISKYKVPFNFALRSRTKRWARRVLPRSMIEMLKTVAAWEFAPVALRKRATGPTSTNIGANPKSSLRAAIRATEQGNNQLALAWLEKAESVRNTALTQVYLGQVWRELKEYDRSESHYRAALALDSFEPQAHVGLAILLAARGAGAEAIDHVRRAAQCGLDSNYGKILLASALVNMGQADEADKLLLQNIPLKLPPPYRSDSRILRFGNSYAAIMAKSPVVSTPRDLVTDIPDGGRAVYFVCCDGVYFDRFIEPAVRSCFQNSGVDFIIHIHLINRLGANESILLRLNELAPRNRLRVSEERVDLSRFNLSGQRSYYACRRFYLLPDLIRSYGRLLLCADVDQLIIGSVEPLLDQMRGYDVGLTHDPLNTLNLPSYFSATAALFAPTASALAYADRLRRYIDYFISIERSPLWHLDQAALAVTYLNDPGLIRLRRFPMSIVQSGPIADNQTDDAIFWSITYSSSKNVEKLRSDRFLKYAS